MACGPIASGIVLSYVSFNLGDKMKRIALVMAAWSAFPLAAVSAPRSEIDLIIDKLVGTLSVYTQPYMLDGQITGCQYIFEAIARDWTYRKGQPLKVTGSIAIMGMGNNIGTTLKVVVNEIRSTDNFRLSFIPSPPSRAYLIDQSMRTNLHSLIKADKSDTPGGLFSVFSPSPTMEMILEIMESKAITIAFNQNSGGSDLQLPIDFTVAQTDNDGNRKNSDKAISDFAICTQRLIERLQ